MRDGLSPPSNPPAIPFHEFLASLMRALDGEGVRYCVLRNYEGFPDANLGNDIDFLIHAAALPNAIHALQSISGTRIVGFTERPYVAMVFLAGISRGTASRTLEIDFDLSLSWKGMPYLANEAVLERAVARQAGRLRFFVPSAEHEAIISLLTGLLSSGKVKEKYFAQIERIFWTSRTKVILALTSKLGSKAAARLVDAAVNGDRLDLDRCAGALRRTLAIRSLLGSPLRTAASVLRHYVRECVLRYSPTTIETVCLSGPPCGIKQGIAADLTAMLASAASIVEKRDLFEKLEAADDGAAGQSNAAAAMHAWRGHLRSGVRLTDLLAQEWIGRLRPRKNLTLRIYENSFAGIQANPQERQPRLTARLAGLLLPAPDLCVRMQGAGGSEGIPDACIQANGAALEPHCRFLRTCNGWVILSRASSAAGVAEGAYAAIVEGLATRIAAKLESRFPIGKALP
jgi:hypothetical protein